MTPQPTARTPTYVKILLVPLLLWAIWGQSTGSAARTSLTIDEGLHVTSGYSILRTADYRLVEEHPPLVKLLQALPLLPVNDLPDPATLRGWESDLAETDSVRLVRATQDLIYPYRPLDRLVVAARVPVALLVVLLGAVVFRWARDLWGWKGGLLALFLLAFDPNILAHAAVAGTDLGAACFFTLSLFCLARFLHRPTWPRLGWAGVTLGLAQGAKLSAVLLLPVVLLLGVTFLPRRRLSLLVPLLGLAGLTLWALYGFEIGYVAGFPFPVPAASHAIPYLRLRQHVADGHAAFLLGRNSSRGWWYYFPVAFALKTPLPTLLMLAAALATGLAAAVGAFRKGRRRARIDASCLLLFPLIYSASSLFSSLNIGYRHLLPILPPLFVFAGRLVRNQTGRVRLIVLAVLLIWLAAGTLALFPHYLAYFNEVAGGADGGWRYLADSNTDWGQAYKDLARFQRQHGLDSVRLSAFIFYDPAIYGVTHEPLTPMRGDTPAVFPSRLNPPPGDYVISATTLDGIPLVDPEMYDWFRRREPDARIGHVLFYYHVPVQTPAPGWLAQCTVPTAPLSPQEATHGFGRDDLRSTYFDCTHAWLYPQGGETPGWYVLFRGGETETEFVQAHRSPARLAYEQRTPREVPPFAVYEWSPPTSQPCTEDRQTGAVIGAPSDQAPAQAWAEGQHLTPPVALDGPLSFLGYRLAPDQDALKPGESVELWTFWSVTDDSPAPLSLMAHLLNDAGQPVAVGDGLGVPIENWRPGDLLVQRHPLAVPPDTPPGTIWIQTGAYWQTEGWPRLSLQVEEGQPPADRILLAQLEVARR